MMLYCSKPGDFNPCHHDTPVSVGTIGPGPRYAAVHCVPRLSEDGKPCLVAMNAFAVPVSFEVFIDSAIPQPSGEQ